MATVRIDARFNGPPASGNGGYCCGVFAAAAGDGPMTVTLRRPPPLDHDLLVARDDAGVRIMDGADVVAEVEPARAERVEPPVRPTPVEAAAASRSYPGFGDHYFPTCFVCGPARDDGLAIFPGAYGDAVAAAWTPDASFTDGTHVRREIVTAALDCPSGWAVAQRDQTPVVLGRMTTWLEPVPASRTFAVVGWPIARDGRKHLGGSALLDAQGRCLARARSTWVELH